MLCLGCITQRATGQASLLVMPGVDLATVGLEIVVEEAKQREQAAAAAAKADAAAAKAAAARVGRATAAAATRGKAKRVPKAAPQAAEPAQHTPADTAIEPVPSVAQSSAAAAAAEHGEEEAQQPAAPSREERYQARNAGLVQQGPHPVRGLGQGHNQLSALTSPRELQGRAGQAREADTAGQPTEKRRKLEPAGLFESLDTGHDTTTAGDAEVMDL